MSELPPPEFYMVFAGLGSALVGGAAMGFIKLRKAWRTRNSQVVNANGVTSRYVQAGKAQPQPASVTTSTAQQGVVWVDNKRNIAQHVNDAIDFTTQALRNIPADVQQIKLSTMSDADNILIVGNKGSGKTTLLLTLLSDRLDSERIALDPHDKPNKWGCTTIGGGRNYVAIATAMQKLHNAMDLRFKQLSRGEFDEGEFPRRTLVGDEYRSIHDEIAKLKRGNKEAYAGVELPGDLILSRISEGRKVGECATIVCHNDTVDALGISGNADMKSCFDYIVYMGGLMNTRARYHGCPDALISIAQQMDRPAVVWSPERNNWYVLVYDLAPVFPPKMSRVIEDGTQDTSGGTHSEVYPKPGTYQYDDDVLVRTTDTTGDGVDDETIKALHDAGWSMNKISTKMKGQKQERLARIRRALGDAVTA